MGSLNFLYRNVTIGTHLERYIWVHLRSASMVGRQTGMGDSGQRSSGIRYTECTCSIAASGILWNPR